MVHRSNKTKTRPISATQPYTGGTEFKRSASVLTVKVVPSADTRSTQSLSPNNLRSSTDSGDLVSPLTAWKTRSHNGERNNRRDSNPMQAIPDAQVEGTESQDRLPSSEKRDVAAGLTAGQKSFSDVNVSAVGKTDYSDGSNSSNRDLDRSVSMTHHSDETSDGSPILLSRHAGTLPDLRTSALTVLNNDTTSAIDCVQSTLDKSFSALSKNKDNKKVFNNQDEESIVVQTNGDAAVTCELVKTTHDLVGLRRLKKRQKKVNGQVDLSSDDDADGEYDEEEENVIELENVILFVF